MSNEFWESEELPNEEILEEVEEQSSVDESEEEMTEEEIRQAFEPEQNEEDSDDTELLTNARLRLEQGKLYEMLLKHNMFGSVDADPRAVKNVEKEIRTFIKERLEVLLGLRADPKLKPATPVIQQVESPFNDLEVELLKRFVAKMSKGATIQSSSNSEITPVVAPKSEGLRPLSFGSPKPQAQVRVSQPAPKPKTIKEPASQVKAPSSEIKKILEEEFGENEMPLGKPAAKMKRSELVERNRRIAQRQAARKAAGPAKVPAPTPDQEAMMMMQHVMARNESLQQGGVNPLNIAITKALQNKAE